jgi:hypothetical protein
VRPEDRSTFKDFAVLFETQAARDAAKQELAARDIQTKMYFRPVPPHDRVLPWADQPLPVTDDVYARILCLPLYASLTDAQIETICAVVDGGRAHTRRRAMTARRSPTKAAGSAVAWMAATVAPFRHRGAGVSAAWAKGPVWRLGDRARAARLAGSLRRRPDARRQPRRGAARERRTPGVAPASAQRGGCTSASRLPSRCSACSRPACRRPCSAPTRRRPRARALVTTLTACERRRRRSLRRCSRSLRGRERFGALAAATTLQSVLGIGLVLLLLGTHGLPGAAAALLLARIAVQGSLFAWIGRAAARPARRPRRRPPRPARDVRLRAAAVGHDARHLARPDGDVPRSARCSATRRLATPTSARGSLHACSGLLFAVLAVAYPGFVTQQPVSAPNACPPCCSWPARSRSRLRIRHRSAAPI